MSINHSHVSMFSGTGGRTQFNKKLHPALGSWWTLFCENFLASLTFRQKRHVCVCVQQFRVGWLTPGEGIWNMRLPWWSVSGAETTSCQSRAAVQQASRGSLVQTARKSAVTHSVQPGQGTLCETESKHPFRSLQIGMAWWVFLPLSHRPASNISTVYCTVNLPSGKQVSPASQSFTKTLLM